MIRVRVGVTFNVSVYHWNNCLRSKCCANRYIVLINDIFTVFSCSIPR